MLYTQIKPHPALTDYIDAFWTVEGIGQQLKKEYILPDGCVDLILNLGADCKTDNRAFTLQSETCYLVGTMTTRKATFLNATNRFIGIRFKPAAFSSFYKYPSLAEITDQTIEFENSFSKHLHKSEQQLVAHLNEFFLNRLTNQKHNLFAVVKDIQTTNGQIRIDALAKRNYTTVRQLQRCFKKHIGVSPKEFTDIVRFQFAYSKIKQNLQQSSFLDIAFDTGYYDHAHLTNAIKRYVGLPPSQL